MNAHWPVQYSLNNTNMPLPTPTSEESKNEFVARCMSDSKMQGEYPDAQQRIAVCIAQYAAE